MRAITLILLVCASILAPGCTVSKSQSGVSGSRPPAVKVVRVPPLTLAIPRKPLGDPDTWPAVGSLAASSTFTPLIGPEHVTSVGWAHNNGIPSVVLDVRFDAIGTQILKSWAKTHQDDQVIVLVGGRVLAIPIIHGEITSGELSLSGPEQGSMQNLLARYGVAKP